MAHPSEGKLLRILGEAALQLEHGDLDAAANTLRPISEFCEEQLRSGVVLDQECAQVARSLFERCAEGVEFQAMRIAESGHPQPISR